MIHVVKPGLLTTVQDQGRWGYQRFGVPVAGPMDPSAHRLANLIVGNRPSAATLEVTLVGPVLEFEVDALVAVTGARFDLQLDGAAVASNTSYAVRCGHRLVFGSRLEGARAYVAVGGGFDVPMVLGSRATHVASGMGGVHGRALRSGDRLPVGVARARKIAAGEVRSNIVTLPRQGARVRVIAGPHDRDFGPAGLHQLQTVRYVVAAQSDRMGYRLQGEPLSYTGEDDLISAPVPIGSVQVPPAGEPIVLMADHQTTGGYPRIGTVITADLGLVGQLSPADWIEFEVCDHDVALGALIAQERALLS